MSEVTVVVKEIPEDVITEATAAFQNGFALLKPFLLALTTEDRQKLFKMADGREPFAGKIIEYVQSNPQFTPGFMDVDSLNTGFTVYGQLAPFCNQFAEFASLSCDTRMVAGVQAMREALKYYDSVQTSTRNRVHGAKVIFDELKKLFARKKSKTAKAEDAA